MAATGSGNMVNQLAVQTQTARQRGRYQSRDIVARVDQSAESVYFFEVA